MENENQNISRLDRIEANLEKLIQAIGELQNTQSKTDEQISELRNSQKQTDEQLKKTDVRLNKTIKKLDEIGKQLGDLGLVQGEVAEDLFYRNVKYIFKKKGINFNTVKRNLKRKGFSEFDIVASNGDEVLVIEVKNKLSARMVDTFINKKLALFRKAFPEYRGYKIAGGIGALVVKDEVGRYAEDSGLYVLTQNSEGGAVLFNKQGFKPKVFE